MAALVADADVPFELPDGWAETAKRLDKKILDLAILGKLVPQDPTDEPASELLKRIAAERKALVKAGKLKVSKCESVIFRGSHRPPYGMTSPISERYLLKSRQYTLAIIPKMRYYVRHD